MKPDTCAAALRIRLLGPVDVTSDAVTRPILGRRRRTVLSVVGLHFGETVSMGRLVSEVWANPPTTAENSVQAHISYLRGLLGVRGAIVTRPRGYALDCALVTTDLAIAQRLIRDSEHQDDATKRVVRLREALDLWRGESLSDVIETTWLSGQAARLEHLRLAAVEALIDARIALGEDLQLLPELEQLTQQYPFHEHFHQQLMLAFYRSGRQAEALAVYQRVWQLMDRELGTGPGPALRRLQSAILCQDSALENPLPRARFPLRTPSSTVGARVSATA